MIDVNLEHLQTVSKGKIGSLITTLKRQQNATAATESPLRSGILGAKTISIGLRKQES